MGQLYCTGPAHVYVSAQNVSQIYYLGTCEDAPTIHLGPEFEPVRNDVTGKKKPLDMQFQGEDALIGLDLNRYNEAVYAAIANRPRNFAGGVRGTNAATDIGTLIATEGLNMILYLLFGFGAAGASPKASMATMPPGYRFPAVVPIAPEILTMGTKPKKINLNFYAWSLWNVKTQISVLYDLAVTGLPPIN